MNDQLLQSIATHISKNEGMPTRPYLDNTGLITAGVGQNVDNWNAFKQVNFLNSSTGQPASESEKRVGYDALTAAKPTMKGLGAAAFTNTTSLNLPETEQGKSLTDRIQADEPKVRAALGTDANGNSVYDTLTDRQKAVMHDIQYSTKGGLSSYHNLIEAAQDGTLSQKYKEVDGTSGGNRNWDRIARNRAAIQDIPFKQAQQGVAQDYQNNPNLPDHYKNLLPAAGKTSDAGTESGDETDSQTADGGQDQQPPQTSSASTTNQSGSDGALPPVDDQAAQQLAQTPDLPPAGTPVNQAFADITNDNTPIQFAAMGKALNDLGGQDSSDGSGNSGGQPATLLASNDPADLQDQAAIVPVDTTSSAFAQDLTGDSEPLQFAAMGAALNDLGGGTPNQTLLGGDDSGALA